MEYVVGPVERHYNLTADRSIACEFEKYKRVTMAVLLVHIVNRPLEPFHAYHTG